MVSRAGLEEERRGFPVPAVNLTIAFQSVTRHFNEMYLLLIKDLYCTKTVCG
jgi:hypothetical protein